jgi:DNA-binding MarR family transcriptional regulator
MPVAESRLVRPAKLEDLLLFRLSRLLAIGGAPVIRLCEGRYGITRREWRVLALLAREDNLLSSELAHRAQLDRARTSKAITSLVAKQLVRRETRPGDRRQAWLALTADGRALFKALFPQVLGIHHDLLKVLQADEMAQLDDMLDRMQARADVLAEQAALPKADRRRGGARVRPVLG